MAKIKVNVDTLRDNANQVTRQIQALESLNSWRPSGTTCSGRRRGSKASITTVRPASATVNGVKK